MRSVSPHHIRRQGQEMQTWLAVDGKWPSHRELIALGGGVIFLQDDESKQQFLVDTGAAFIVLLQRSQSTPAGPPISGADGKDISCWGRICLCLTLGLRTFFVTFLLAAVYGPILRLGFLSACGLLVNPVGHQVLDSKSLKPLSKLPTAAGRQQSKLAPELCSIPPTKGSLLAAFSTITGGSKGTTLPKHKIHHTIEMTGRLVFTKAPSLDPDKLAQQRRNSASWRRQASSAVVTRLDCHRCTWSARKTGHGGYAATTVVSTWQSPTTSIPFPSILDLSNKLHGCKYFSCVDLMKGYHTDGTPGHSKNDNYNPFWLL